MPVKVGKLHAKHFLVRQWMRRDEDAGRDEVPHPDTKVQKIWRQVLIGRIPRPKVGGPPPSPTQIPMSGENNWRSTQKETG